MSKGPPPPAGTGNRIHEIRDPASEKKAAHQTSVEVTGATVIAIDEYDETGNGRSSGTIYISDLGSTEPYSGISLFNPSFVPGNLRVGPGDTLDFRGEYQENNAIPVQFAPGAALIQLSGPIGTFRFDADIPPPVEVPIEDLLDFEKGSKWLNMAVTVKNVKVQRDARTSTSGRLSITLLPDPPNQSGTGCEDPFPKAPTLVNELMNMSAFEPKLKAGVVIKSLTGIVTFFCNLHIAPRYPGDIVL